MEIVLLYVGKVSCIMAIFCLAYQLFLKKETFFEFNRYFLWIGIVLALVLPFVNIVNYIEVAPIVHKTIEPITISGNSSGNFEAIGIDWISFLFMVYVIGVIVFGLKLVVQLLSLYNIIRNNTVTKFGGFRYVESNEDIAPFSFFNYIFYNPALYSEEELSIIIKHEVIHSQQAHSIDVLLTRLVTIATWMNPFSWLYESSVKQNLEFLADNGAIQEVGSAKGYQYALLKVSGNQLYTPIVNTFYNSFIKKRIVMLNKSKSNKMNILKTVSVLPAVAIFLVSFNTREVYIPMNSDSDSSWAFENPAETIEIIIDKNTTDAELKEMKTDLAKKGIDFSYKKVVHNASNEITSISIEIEAKNKGSKTKTSSSFNNDDKPIDPILIVYDADSNSISMGNSKNVHMDIHEDGDHSIWVHSDDEGKEYKTVEIIEEDGKEIIKVNGNEVSREVYEAMKDDDGNHKKIVKIRKSKGGGSNEIFITHDSDEDEKEIHKKHIRIKKSKKDGHNNVFILKDSDHDDDDIIKIDGGKGFFFIDTDGDENTLFLIDGKESTKEEVKKMDPSEIEKIEVFKGDGAEEKYGDKGKNGVVEITSKKKKN